MHNNSLRYNAIPYFGENNNSIREMILNDEELETIEQSIYDFVISNINSRVLVIIDNKWLVWLNDIIFNYRDKKSYLAYWKFDTMPLDEDLVKKDDKQYLMVDENDNFLIRYNYEYNRINIEPNIELSVYNLDKQYRYKVKLTCWINDNTFDIDKLYKLYVASAYENDKLLEDNIKGRYFISKYFKGMTNRELKLRNKLGLSTYVAPYSEEEYRDVREYTKDEMVIKYGLVDDSDNYWIRRLRFECYLYCILRKNILSNDVGFNKQFEKLGKTLRFIKYGDSIKFILKDYWLNNYCSKQVTTWMKHKQK